MVETFASGSHVAKKAHDDSSYEYLRDWINNCRPFRNEQLSFTEWREIVNLLNNCGKIKPGQLYNWQRNKQDGYIFTWKSLPAIEAICKKKDMYPYSEWA